MALRVSNVALRPDEPETALADRLALRVGLETDQIVHWRILRKSLDARRRNDPRFVYTAEVELDDHQLESTLIDQRPDVSPSRPERFEWPEPGTEPLPDRPVIVGSGPAGLFAAYFLATSGYRPIVLERGQAVKERVADVRRFDSGGPLNPESNYLFGEGGAGTFSDGKLTCRNTGPDVHRVLEVLVDCHGKPEILYENRPHLGSNRLPLIVRTLRRKIEDAGGEVRFNCRLEDLDRSEGPIRSVMTSSGTTPTSALILAIGHSARDTFEMLWHRGVPLQFKPFQLGVRIEQPQEQVDRARYGPFAGHPALGAADYELSARTESGDLFTFCMCAGGYVMPSVSEPEHFCTNGMSESRHDSPFANSGLVITIGPDLVKTSNPMAGVRFQRAIEHAAFATAGGAYAAPIQWANDFLRNRSSRGELPSSYPRGVTPTDLHEFLPKAVIASLHRGLPQLDRMFRGLFLQDATLTGPEARGSSPSRIPRDRLTRECPDVPGLYPCGEGAGYAGGIISAAVDGLRTARAIVARYAPPR